MKIRSWLPAVIVLAVLYACSPFYQVKPDILRVKRLAIISVYDVGHISMKKGGAGLLSLVNDLTADREGFSYRELLQIAHDSFEKEFSGISQWQMVPFARIAREPAYQKFLERMNKHFFVTNFGILSFGTEGTAASNQFSFDKVSMNTYVLDGSVYPPKQYVMDLCAGLDLDAVIVIGLDLRYEPGAPFMGRATTGIEINVIDNTTKYVGGTVALDRNGATRFESKSQVPLVMNVLPYNKDSFNMFRETIQAAAVFYGMEINKELGK